MSGRFRGPALLATCSLLAAARGAEARPKHKKERQAPKPWEESTTKAQRDEARQLYERGNERFVDSDYAKALGFYQRAVAIYDNPLVQLSIVRTLVLLDRPVEAHEHLEAALRYGELPFTPDEYQEALDRQAELARQLGTLIIGCTAGAADGALVTLDGQNLLVCPGEANKVVSPGSHQVVGTKDGMQTYTTEVDQVAGETTTIDVTLKRAGATTTKTVYAPPPDPDVLVGGGAFATSGAVGVEVGLTFRVAPVWEVHAAYLYGDSTSALPGENVDNDLHIARLRATRLIPRQSRFLPFLGGSVIINHVKVEQPSTGQTETATVPGLAIEPGVYVRISPHARLFAELPIGFLEGHTFQNTCVTVDFRTTCAAIDSFFGGFAFGLEVGGIM